MQKVIADLKASLARANTKISKLEFRKDYLEAEIKRLKSKLEKNVPEAQKIRNSKQYKEFRRQILERDGYKCTACGSTEKLQVHHIKEGSKYPELIMDSGNVITLCMKCHALTNNYFSK